MKTDQKISIVGMDEVSLMEQEIKGIEEGLVGRGKGKWGSWKRKARGKGNSGNYSSVIQKRMSEGWDGSRSELGNKKKRQNGDNMELFEIEILQEATG